MCNPLSTCWAVRVEVFKANPEATAEEIITRVNTIKAIKEHTEEQWAHSGESLVKQCLKMGVPQMSLRPHPSPLNIVQVIGSQRRVRISLSLQSEGWGTNHMSPVNLSRSHWQKSSRGN